MYLKYGKILRDLRDNWLAWIPFIPKKFDKIQILHTSMGPKSPFEGYICSESTLAHSCEVLNFSGHRGPPYACKENLKRARDSAPWSRASKSVVRVSIRSKSVLIEIRPLLEIPWNGEAAGDIHMQPTSRAVTFSWHLIQNGNKTVLEVNYEG